jgi:hypothetical protein
LGLLYALVIAELQIFGYAASSLRYHWSTFFSSELPGPSPGSIIAGATAPADRSLTLLAAGDVARCSREDFAGKVVPNLAYALGLPVQADTEKAAAAGTAALAANWPKAPILALGDLAYADGTPAEFATCFDPLWGGLKPRILPAPGNHEYNTPGAFGYFDYWDAQAGPDRRGYYSVRWRSWLILSLNSEIDAAPGSDQATWLAGELEKAPTACVLAFYHKPAYSLRPRKGSANAVHLFRQLQAAGASLVVNGHNHFYERTKPLDAEGRIDVGHGTVAFTVGTGGPVRRARQPVDETAKAVFETPGLLRLELSAEAYAWRFHDAADGAVLDSGSAPCLARRPGA